MQRADSHAPPDRPHDDRAAFPDVWSHAHAQVDAHAAPDRYANANRNDHERVCSVDWDRNYVGCDDNCQCAPGSIGWSTTDRDEESR